MRTEQQTMPAVAAHRAWHQDGAPKNSIPALEEAAQHGVDMVENDLRILGDGTIIVHHDAHINGVPLEQLDRSVLAANPHIPTLEAWAKRAGELDVHGLIEIKSGGFEAEALEILRRHMRDEKLTFFSFQPEVVKRMRELVPHRPAGLLSDLASPAVPTTKLVGDARAVGANFLGLNVRQATDEVLAAAHDAKLGVAIWTVVDEADHARLLASPNVTAIISDVPQLALKTRTNIFGREALRAVRMLRV
jgi:glycerophosphoryl diester phosphodiesterase